MLSFSLSYNNIQQVAYNMDFIFFIYMKRGVMGDVGK